ncbi:siderophore ABC transporter substrate-binding protein [Sutcliffiella cohnii]
MKKWLSVLLFMTVMTVLAACGTSNNTSGTANNGSGDSGNGDSGSEVATLTIEHELGTTEVSKSPEKVVVFDFGILDSLDQMDVEVAGVPQANIPPYLSKYEDSKYENVGSLKEPDFEKISEINPDLIIISGRQAESYDELSKIGPTIFLGVDTNDYLNSFTKNMETLGEIFEQEEFIQQQLATVKESIEALKEKATALNKNALIVLANEGNISAYGAGSRFGIIHDEFGFTPVDAGIEVSTHGMNVSFEYILEQDPDYLFVIDRGAAVAGESSAKQTVENAIVEKTKAYQNGNIVYLDPNYWYLSGGGLTSVQEMVKEIEGSIK